MENKTQLSVSTEVLEKLTERAALEIEGVKGIAKKAVDIRGAVKARSVVKAVKIESINGAIKINAYISLKPGANIKDVAEKVQANIKDKIQTMTGTAVTQVNVSIADIEFEKPESED